MVFWIEKIDINYANNSLYCRPICGICVPRQASENATCSIEIGENTLWVGSLKAVPNSVHRRQGQRVVYLLWGEYTEYWCMHSTPSKKEKLAKCWPIILSPPDLTCWLGQEVQGSVSDSTRLLVNGDQGEVLALIVDCWLTRSRHFSIVSVRTKGEFSHIFGINSL